METENENKTPVSYEWLLVALLLGISGDYKTSEKILKCLQKRKKRSELMSIREQMKEFIIKHPEEVEKIENYFKCKECENETMLKYAELATELDKYKRYNKLLNDCLDTKEEYCKELRKDNDNLRYKNELYLEKIKKLEGSENE